MAASASGDAHSNINVATVSQRCSEDALSQSREMIKPSVLELTKEVRKNILCTVEGCGKILPNTPALNMHLVKSHRVKDGVFNWTVRKDMKGSQKLYCCPIEGCPRGPNRPFSQFSLVKQHFMKMHAEKKHKCSKCSNGYSTEWDLRRHVEHCGKTYRCTCGCPYASRTSLLSHVYRTGHEVPSEHRYPPVKKRKMDKLVSGAAKVKADETPYQILSAQVVLVNVPVMQLAHLPVLLTSAESGALRSVVLAVESLGHRVAPHLLPQSVAAVVPRLEAAPACHSSLEPVGAGERVKSEPAGAADGPARTLQRGRSSTSTDIQTDISYLARGAMGVGVCPMGESSVSSCSQTDISVSAQVLLPVSVETQTFPSKAKVISTIGAQTDRHGLSQPPCASSSSPSTTRQTQTVDRAEERARMDQAIASHLFDCDSLSVSTQTAADGPFRTYHHDDPMSGAAIVLDDDEDDEKSAAGMCFGAQTDELQSSGMADNQTQTQLFNDLENILSDSMAGHQGLADWLGGADAPLESLDIQTQTDFLLLDGLGSGEGAGRGQSDLELEMFDTQTQTDLNLFLTSNETQTINMDDLLSADLAWNMESHFSSVETQTDLDVLHGAAGHMPLGSILRQSGFSMSTESSDTEMQTDLPSLPPPPHHHTQHAVSQGDQTRPLSSAETQTAAGSWECLGNLFLTSIETQTGMDDGRGRPES